MSLERDIASAGVWHDAGGLTGLRKAAREDADGALEEAARQFEALFVGQMFSAMRATVPDDGPLASDEEKHWHGLLDRQLALDLTRGAGTGSGSGFGLADAIVRQLGDRGAPALAAPSAAAFAEPGANPGVLPGKAAPALPLAPAATPFEAPAARRDGTAFALEHAGRSRVAAARDGASPPIGPQAPQRGADDHGMPPAPPGDAAASRAAASRNDRT